MESDPERRSMDALRQWVAGDGGLSVLRSGLRGVPNATIRRLLADHRREFEALNPDRAVLLEAVALAKRD